MGIFSTRIFNRRAIITITLVFCAIFIAANMTVRYTCNNIVEFDCPEAWPISLFYPMIPTVWEIGLALVLSLGFYPAAQYLDRRGYRLGEVIVLAVVLVAGTNMLSGFAIGYNEPMTHRDEQYYNDALTIDDPIAFIQHYEELQPTLGQHSQTHPPGPALTLYVLERIFRKPEIISLVLGAVAMAGSLFFAYGVFEMAFAQGDGDNSRWAGYGALLFAVLPAIQIYYIATIDALVTMLLTGVLYFFLRLEHTDNSRVKAGSSIGAIICLFYAVFINIPAVIIVPVLIGYEWLRHKRIGRSVVITGIVGLLVLSLIPLFNLNFYHLLRSAERFENAGGFALLVNPATYFFTRLECVAEILLFFGPFLIVLAVRGWPVIRREYRNQYMLLGLLILTMIGIFLIGTYRTGETARPLSFLYVYALFPVLAYLRRNNATMPERISILMLVFTQTVYMQLLGHYLW